MSETIKGPYKLFKRSDASGTATFQPKPTCLVLIAQLEIVVEDEFGTYLLLISPRYEEVEVTDGDEKPLLPEGSHWTVPYIAKTIHSSSGGYLSVSHTISAAKTHSKKWGAKELLETHASTIFRGLGKLHRGEDFYELKRSWSQPQVTKLYRFVRYRADLDNCDGTTLAGAESRKGIAFIPIDDDRFESVTSPRYCNLHKRSELLYLSKPIESNVAAILQDDDKRSELRERAIRVDRQSFFTEYKGLLFCGDIAGYGAATGYAADHMSDFSDKDFGAVLRDSAAVAFTELFLRAGAIQVHTAGDGFICAIPLGLSSSPQPHETCEGLMRFLEAYGMYTAKLDTFSAALAKHFQHNRGEGEQSPMLGSRLAIHFGPYRYGKMSQAASLLTGFDGREVVTVARLEQGLRTVAKDPEHSKRHDIASTLHLAAASSEAVEAIGGIKRLPPPLVHLGDFEAVSKEFESTAALLRVGS